MTLCAYRLNPSNRFWPRDLLNKNFDNSNHSLILYFSVKAKEYETYITPRPFILEAIERTEQNSHV